MSYEIKPIVREVADIVAGNGVFISPKPNGFFSPLVSARTDVIDMNADKEEPVVSTESFRKVANRAFASVSPNGFVMPSLESEEADIGMPVDTMNEKAFQELVPLVSNIKQQMRSVVIPTVNSIHETVIEKVNANIADVSKSVKIISDHSDLIIFSSPTLHDLAKDCTFSVSSSRRLNSQVMMPNFTGEEVRSLILLNSPDVDSQVTEALTLVPDADSFLAEVYAFVFGNGGDTIADTPLKSALFPLITLLLVRKLSLEIPEAVAGVGFEDYTIYMRQVGTYYANLWDQDHRKRQDRMTRGVLVLDMNRPDFTVTVNGSIYKDWLVTGGEVDYLTGLFISGEVETLGSRIVEKGDAYLRSWSNHLAIVRSSRLDNFKALFVTYLIKELHDYAVGAEITWDKDIDYIRQRMSSITEDTTYQFCRRAVIACYWPGTEYLPILENIDSVSEKNQLMCLNQAVDIATIDWLVKWALSHVNIEN